MDCMGYDGVSMVELHQYLCGFQFFSGFFGPYLHCANASASRNPRRHHMKLDVQEHDQRSSRRTEGPNPTLMLRQILKEGVLWVFGLAPDVHSSVTFTHCTMVFGNGNEEASGFYGSPIPK